MRAIVLVGGEGTRLRPLTFDTPKQMLPVAQLPMIERVLEQLAAHDVDDAVLSLGYKPEVFTSHFRNNKWRDMKLTFAIEPPTLLDTAGAIGFAAKHGNVNETFIAVNGDVLTDIDVTALVAFHRASKAEATIALTPVEDPSRFGVVPTDKDGRVEAFIEKPKREDAPTNYINAGTYVLEPSVLSRIGPGRVSIEREVFPALAKEGTMFAVQSNAYWLDTGTPEQYIQANLDYLRGARANDPLKEARREGDNWIVGAAELEGEVRQSLIANEVEVAEDAVVECSVLGKGVTIERGAYVRNSVLLAEVHVGANATVTDSAIGAGAKLHDEARIEQYSVLGFGAEAQSSVTIRNTRVGVD